MAFRDLLKYDGSFLAALDCIPNTLTQGLSLNAGPSFTTERWAIDSPANHLVPFRHIASNKLYSLDTTTTSARFGDRECDSTRDDSSLFTPPSSAETISIELQEYV